jgi:hypothetical protein
MMGDLEGASQSVSLRRQLTEAQENLRLLEERQSEYVLSTDVPSQLIKEKRKLCKRIASLKTELSRSVQGAVGENEALLVASYLREAALAGLDMGRLPHDNLGAMLERIVRQIIERDCDHLSRGHAQIPSADEFCRLLSYLGWYMFNEGIISCDPESAVVEIQGILADLERTKYKVEPVLDWLVTTYWFQETSRGAFEFRDSYIINVFAAMELKERFPTVYDSATLGLGPGSDPAKWQKTIVLLAGMLAPDQAAELLKVLLDLGWIQLAGRCIVEGQPIPHSIVACVINALLGQLGSGKLS